VEFRGGKSSRRKFLFLCTFTNLSRDFMTSMFIVLTYALQEIYTTNRLTGIGLIIRQ
jgi:hypothetical protein